MQCSSSGSKIITRFLVELGSEADDFIRLTQIKSFVEK